MVAQQITPELTVEAVLNMSTAHREILVRYFGAGVTMPTETWTHEPLQKAALMRGVDLKSLLDDLNGVSSSS